MLIENFDKLTAGKLVRRIVFIDSEVTAPSPGMKILLALEHGNADAWICYDETGIWLSSNAHVSDRTGYRGFEGFEEPLSAIREIVFAAPGD